MSKLSRRDFVAILAAAAVAVKVRPRVGEANVEPKEDPAPPVLPRWIGHC